MNDSPFDSDEGQLGDALKFEGLAWIPLSDRYPATGERVLIKMANGDVEVGTWRGDAGTWSYSPFVAWQMPVSWAPLPKSMQSGSRSPMEGF